MWIDLMLIGEHYELFLAFWINMMYCLHEFWWFCVGFLAAFLLEPNIYETCIVLRIETLIKRRFCSELLPSQNRCER